MNPENKEFQFEWDEEKNEINFQKHGIYFEDAVLVFHDRKRINRIDWKHSDGELRYQTMGRVSRDIVFVVYTLRDRKIRIISARFATREERGFYL